MGDDRLELPGGWVFGTAEDRAAWLEEVRRTNPEWAERYEAAVAASAPPTSAFVAYEVGCYHPIYGAKPNPRPKGCADNPREACTLPPS